MTRDELMAEYASVEKQIAENYDQRAILAARIRDSKDRMRELEKQCEAQSGAKQILVHVLSKTTPTSQPPPPPVTTAPPEPPLPEPVRKYDVLVNNCKYVVEGDLQSYLAVAGLWDSDPAENMPLVTWESADGSEGNMLSPESLPIKVHDGMKFAVVDSPRAMVRVTINGKQHQMARRRYTHNNLATIAGFSIPTDRLTVTYCSPEGVGTLPDGEHLLLVADMAINVTDTADAQRSES